MSSNSDWLIGKLYPSFPKTRLPTVFSVKFYLFIYYLFYLFLYLFKNCVEFCWTAYVRNGKYCNKNKETLHKIQDARQN